MIQSITVYSNGDSNDLATWSNVPYLFCRALEKRGIKVYRVNIEANKILKRLFNTASYYLYRKILHKNACPEYNRTWMHRLLTERKISKANKMFPNTDLNLFLSYAFINKKSDKPNVLWCDWTDRVSIERMGRKPQWYERAGLKYEDYVLANADALYTMFPVCKEKMEEYYSKEFRYLNRNVINTVYNGTFDLKRNINTRFASKKIIFIGNHRYKSAAYELAYTYNRLKKFHTNLTLDIIGMKKSELSEIDSSDGITFHGYLNKRYQSQCDLYYKLIQEATILVNPARQWGAYSSTVEAMYYGCPVVVSPYDDFVKEFGVNIGFGVYANNKNDLQYCIDMILNAPYEKYRQMSICAHKKVADHTWDNYIDCFLLDLNSIGIS